MTDGAQFGNAQIAEKVFDHGTDAVCAIGIVATAATDAATPFVVGGLVSIALGKRFQKGMGQ